MELFPLLSFRLLLFSSSGVLSPFLFVLSCFIYRPFPTLTSYVVYYSFRIALGPVLFLPFSLSRRSRNKFCPALSLTLRFLSFLSFGLSHLSLGYLNFSPISLCAFSLPSSSQSKIPLSRVVCPPFFAFLPFIESPRPFLSDFYVDIVCERGERKRTLRERERTTSRTRRVLPLEESVTRQDESRSQTLVEIKAATASNTQGKGSKHRFEPRSSRPALLPFSRRVASLLSPSHHSEKPS